MNQVKIKFCKFKETERKNIINEASRNELGTKTKKMMLKSQLVIGM